MAHAIGCIGTSANLRTVQRKMTRAERARNQKLVPAKRRNQTRAVAFIEVIRNGEASKIKAIRDGHLSHYQAAYYFADEVRYVTGPDGKKLVVKRK